MKLLKRKTEQAELTGEPRTFGPGRRLLSFVLSLVLLLGLLPTFVEVPAEAAGNGTYLLRVGTGGSAGDSIRCFGIRYRDTQGIVRTQYIYPHEGDADTIYSRAGNVNALNNRVNILKGLTGYTIDGLNNGSFAMNSDGNALQIYSTDYFIFEPLHPFAELICIDVCMFLTGASTTSKTWECMELSFFQVESFHNVNVTGYLSKDPHLLFKGKLLAEMGTKDKNGKVTLGNERNFYITNGDVIYKCDGTSGTNHKPMQFYKNGIDVDDEGSGTFLFEIDFADVLGGGIEALAADYNAGGLRSTVEALCLTVQYKNTADKLCQVKLPVISSALTWAVENGYVGGDLPIIGIAQQGEHLFFKAYFPEFKEFTSFELYYGSEAAEKAGLDHSGMNDRQKERLMALSKESFHLDAFKIYPGNTTVTRDNDFSPASLYLKTSAKPILQYGSGKPTGEIIAEGTTEIEVSEKEPDKSQSNKNQGTFLIAIETDNFPLAATVDEVYVSLRYLSINGNEISTQDYNLKEAAEEYFGYWPGTDAALRHALSPGSTLYFPVTISNVDTLLGATLRIDTGRTGTDIDDWQMKSLSIWDYKEASERRARWENTSYSDRVFWRDRTLDPEKDLEVKYPNDIDLKEAEADGITPAVYLCTDTPKVSITFNNEGRTVVREEEERDWDALRYSMSIAEARQDLKFKTAMCEYTVSVQIANNDGIDLGNGDAGSNDLFYFMLDFQNGSSAYVLANQQLAADGFRTGATESFVIYTNRDYGPLVSIHIIPEHSTDDSLFDKLNIQKIKVSKKSNEPVSKMWVFDNVGWVGIDYFDKGAESSIRGRPGRSEAELAQVFHVTYEGYNANILFALETGDYGNFDRFRGVITADMEYYDINGEFHTYHFDVLEAIYDYAGIRPEKVQVTGSEGGKDNNLATVDTSFMLRQGKTDRFVLSVENLRQIIGFRFNIRAVNSSKWTLNSVSVYTIESMGLLQINAMGEYQRSNKVTLLASSKEGGSAECTASNDRSKASHGAEQTISISMEEHSIAVDMKASSWTPTISRAPVSNDDSLNVYVYTKNPIPEEDRANYSMKLAVECRIAKDDSIYQVSDSNIAPSADGTMFYALGLPAHGIRSVTQLALEANARGEYTGLERAVVQHIRGGVTINSYTFELGGRTVENTQQFVPVYSDNNITKMEKQVLRLLFAEDVEEQAIEQEVNDLAVAIRYSSTNDALRNGTQMNRGGIQYNSKYIYLSDLTTTGADGKAVQKYTDIKPGMIAEIEFNESYVGDIVGISLASIGSLQAHIQSAYIQCESTLSGGSGTQWYNFAEEIYPDNAPQLMLKSDVETVVPVKMVFDTAEGAINMGSGSGLSDEIPIRLEVAYLNARTNTVDTAVLEDINIYLRDGGFRSNEKATVEFFLTNVDDIRYITLEPHSVYASSAAWKVRSVEYEMCQNGVTPPHRVKTVNQEILQGDPLRVNLSQVYTKVETKVSSSLSGNTPSRTMYSYAADPVLKISLEAGQALRIQPEVVGTLDGYGYTFYAVRGESVFEGVAVNCYSVSWDGTEIQFKPPQEKTTLTYAIRVGSEEMPECCCDIIVTVKAVPVEEEKEEPEPAAIPDSETGKPSKGDDDDDETGSDDTEPKSGDEPPAESPADEPDA